MPVTVENMEEILAVKEPARTMRKNLLDMAMAGIDAVMPENLIPTALTREGDTLTVKGLNGSFSLDISSHERVLVAGAGKASAGMGKALVEILEDVINGGHINSIENSTIDVHGGEITVTAAGHPVPDEKGLEGAKRIRDIFVSAGENDLIIFLLSGGASSMLPLPANGITLDDMKNATAALLRSGASIQEANCVRRHMSAVKGGKLAALTKATVLTLIISDVVGNQLESIGSGPTAPDPTTYEEADAVIRKYGLEGRIPEAVEKAIGRENETVKPGDGRLGRVKNIIIADNGTAVKAMRNVAVRRNCRFQTFYDLTGDVDDMARVMAEQCSPPGLCIGGGEMTVSVHGNGMGGRCQEFILRLFRHGYRGVTLAMGTDGLDGNSGAAGGIFDNEAMAELERKGMGMDEFLERNDSYSLLSEVSTAIITGYTGTNVGDIYIMLPFGLKKGK